MKVRLLPFLSKTSAIVLIFLLPLPSVWYSVLFSIIATVTYQYIIALFYKDVHVMPSMDAACFLGDDSARVNFISVTTVERFDVSIAREKSKKYMSEKAKLRYKVVEILGDYYWKDTGDVDKVID